MDGRHWVLWDGDCAFCSRAVGWAARQDKQNRLHCVAYQNAPSPPMTPKLFAACEYAVHVVTADGKILRAARACLFVLEQLGWAWQVRLLRLPPVLWFLENIYKIVASHRDFFANFFFTREERADPNAL